MDGPELIISYFSVIFLWKSHIAAQHELQDNHAAGKTLHSFLLESSVRESQLELSRMS